MPAKKKAAPVQPEPLTCGACRHCVDSPRFQAVCHGNPPAVLFDPEGDPVSIRPIVRPEDAACHIFQPRLNS